MTEWINYHGLNRHLFVPPTQGPRPMTDAERIKELEARAAKLKDALQRLVNASEPVEEYTHEVAIELEEAIKTAKSVLKEPDQ